MKKLFNLMVFAGVMIAVLAAGSTDAGLLSFSQALGFGVLSSSLVLCGSYFIERGEES